MNMIFKNWSRLKKNKKKGFTLVELLIVIAVLGIISTIGLTSMQGVVDTFKEKADEKTAEQIARQVEFYVLAGIIKSDTDDVENIDYPDSQSNNEPLTANVRFTNGGDTCIVTITDDNGFSYDVEIESEEVK